MGNFKISSTVDNTAIQVNDGVTLKITVSGKGNLNDITLPQPAIPKDFEIYDPKRTVLLDKNSKNSGKVVYEYLLLARAPGEHKISNISLSYFDTKEKKFKTVSGSEHVITVTGTAAGNNVQRPASGYARRDVEVLASDIRYIKKDLTNIYDKKDKDFRPGKLAVYLTLSLILMLSTFFLRIYILKNLNDTAMSRRKKAVKNANKRLKNSIKALVANDLVKFYKTLDEALLKFIADKFNISHAGIIVDDIAEGLKDKGIDENTIKEMKAVLSKSASAQFAPVKPDMSEMSSDISRVKELMININERLKQGR